MVGPMDPLQTMSGHHPQVLSRRPHELILGWGRADNDPVTISAGRPGVGRPGALRSPLRPAQSSARVTLLRALPSLLTVPVLVAAVVQPGPLPPWWAAPALLVAAVLSTRIIAAAFPTRKRWPAAAQQAPVAAALVLAPGVWTALALGLVVPLSSLVARVHRARHWGEAHRMALATGAGAVLVVALRAAGVDGLISAAAGIMLSWLVSHLLAAAAAAATTGRSLLGLVRTQARESFTAVAVAASLGLATGYLAAQSPPGLLGLIAPLALLGVTATEDIRRQADMRAAVELARVHAQECSSALAHPEAERAPGEIAARALVTAAARLVGGADVELLLVTDEGPVRFEGDETGRVHRQRVPPTVFDEALVVRALAAAQTVTLAPGGAGTSAAVSLLPNREIGAHASSAVLVVRRPPGGTGLRRSDRLALQAVSAQARGWLSPVSQASSARTARPESAELNLQVVRDAALRLARAAGTGVAQEQETVTRLVDELHVVERAVAGLLGGQRSGPGNATPDRPAQQWTTSGVYRRRS
jgi:hypothetical protein